MPLSSSISKAYVQTVETASRALTLADAFALIHSNNGALVFTVNANIFVEGTQISLLSLDGGLCVFAAGAGVTLTTPASLGPTGIDLVASIILSPTANTWIVIGSI